MKKCRQCSKPASLHITEIREGAVQEIHLCENCAHEYLHNPDGVDSESDADGFPIKLQDHENLAELDQLTCPNCGISFREFRSAGRLGCPHDYIAFEAELLPLLENIHGDTQHDGKVPRRAPDESRRQYRLIRLRNELQTAVENEAYEDAARLRDEIQTLEVELQQGLTESEAD